MLDGKGVGVWDESFRKTEDLLASATQGTVRQAGRVPAWGSLTLYPEVDATCEDYGRDLQFLKRRSDIQFCYLQGSSMIALLIAWERC